MITLSLGFGTQVGLFTYLKRLIKDNRTINNAGAVTSVSTGTSSASMIVCCAHHLSKILPIIGFSAFAVFLTRYQIPIIVFGIVMNLLGILYMLRQIKKIKSHYDQIK
ncbi:MAG: hypothetical protein AAB437_03095 [Patescibacteria group bacterium]